MILTVVLNEYQLCLFFDFKGSQYFFLFFNQKANLSELNKFNQNNSDVLFSTKLKIFLVSMVNFYTLNFKIVSSA